MIGTRTSRVLATLLAGALLLPVVVYWFADPADDAIRRRLALASAAGVLALFTARWALRRLRSLSTPRAVFSLLAIGALGNVALLPGVAQRSGGLQIERHAGALLVERYPDGSWLDRPWGPYLALAPYLADSRLSVPADHALSTKLLRSVSGVAALEFYQPDDASPPAGVAPAAADVDDTLEVSLGLRIARPAPDLPPGGHWRLVRGPDGDWLVRIDSAIPRSPP